jgi:hypothetical protein
MHEWDTAHVCVFAFIYGDIKSIHTLHIYIHGFLYLPLYDLTITTSHLAFLQLIFL